MGIIYSVLGSILLAVSISMFGHYGKGIPSSTLALFKNLSVFLGLLIIMILNQTTFNILHSDLFLISLSGLLGMVIGTITLYKSIKSNGIILTSLGVALVGPTTLVLNSFINNEQMHPLEMLASIFLTASLFLSKANSNRQEYKICFKSIIPLIICVLSNSLSIVLINSATVQSTPLSTTFFRLVPSIPFLLTVVLLGKANNKKEVLNLKQSAPILLATSLICSLGGLYLATKSVFIVGAGISASILYSFPLWTTLIQKLCFKKELPLKIHLSLSLNFLGTALFIVTRY